eukprot:scaffold16832_cov115-Isochrysis_galbana.AAC.1
MPCDSGVCRTISRPASAEAYDVEELTVQLRVDGPEVRGLFLDGQHCYFGVGGIDGPEVRGLFLDGQHCYFGANAPQWAAGGIDGPDLRGLSGIRAIHRIGSGIYSWMGRGRRNCLAMGLRWRGLSLDGPPCYFGMGGTDGPQMLG